MRLLRKMSIVICCLLFSLSTMLLGFEKLGVINVGKDGEAINIGDNSHYIRVNEIWDGSEFNNDNLDYLLQLVTGRGDVSTSNMGYVDYLAENTLNSADMRVLPEDTTTDYPWVTPRGKDLIVRFGGLDWQVMYLSNDISGNSILTLWLCNNVQSAWSGRTQHLGEYYGLYKGGLYSDWSANWLSSDVSDPYPSNMYGTSYVRAVTLNNGGAYAISTTQLVNARKSSSNPFAKFTMSGVSGSVVDYLTTPSEMRWQATMPTSILSQLGDIGGGRYSNEVWNKNESSSRFDKSESNYANKDGSDAWKNDYLWLPSWQEIGYYSTDCSTKVGAFYYVFDGLWGTSLTQRENGNNFTPLNQEETIGSANTSKDCNNNIMARTGGNEGKGDKLLAHNETGYFCSTSYVSSSSAVRPALHLNLSKITKSSSVYNFEWDFSLASAPTVDQSRSGVSVGETINFPTPSKPGYTLTGWKHGGVTYKTEEGKLRFVVPELNTEGTTKRFTAVWKANEYDVTLNNQSATSPGTTMIKVTYNSSLEKITIPKKTGYEFKGYFSQTDGGGERFFDGNGNPDANNKVWLKTDITELFAYWVAGNYKIVYSSDGGEGTMKATEFTYSSTGSFTLSTCDFYKPGSLFVEWRDKYGNTYKDGATVANSFYTENITLSAQWHKTYADEKFSSSSLAGGGTVSDPYLITSGADLAFLSRKVQERDEEYSLACYKQTGHIDLGGHTWLPIGGNRISTDVDMLWDATSILSDSAFGGVYDGQNYAIYNVDFYSVTNARDQQLYNAVGLFGQTSGATIRNIKLFPAELKGFNGVGGLIGYAYTGLIENCISYVNVDGNSACGMIGVGEGVTIRNCFYHGNVTGMSDCAGLIGGNYNTEHKISISNSLAQGTISGNDEWGDLIAGIIATSFSEVTISNCAFLGKVNYGYILTGDTAAAIIENCYAECETDLNLCFNASEINCSLFIAAGEKYYYRGKGDFSEWTMYNGKPLPSGLTWIGNIKFENEQFLLEDFNRLG